MGQGAAVHRGKWVCAADRSSHAKELMDEAVDFERKRQVHFLWKTTPSSKSFSDSMCASVAFFSMKLMTGDDSLDRHIFMPWLKSYYFAGSSVSKVSLFLEANVIVYWIDTSVRHNWRTWALSLSPCVCAHRIYCTMCLCNLSPLCVYVWRISHHVYVSAATFLLLSVYVCVFIKGSFLRAG